MVKKRICLLIFYSAGLLLTSCYASGDDPPFPKDIYLNYNGANLILGYSTMSEVEQILGQPDETSIEEFGGEGFLWRNFKIYSYYNDRLALLFSIEKDRLIRIVFKTTDGDRYSTFSELNERKTRDDILAYFEKSKRKIDHARSGTFWVDYFVREDPPLSVIFGFQFNADDSLKALNYYIDTAWW